MKSNIALFSLLIQTATKLACFCFRATDLMIGFAIGNVVLMALEINIGLLR